MLCFKRKFTITQNSSMLLYSCGCAMDLNKFLGLTVFTIVNSCFVLGSALDLVYLSFFAISIRPFDLWHLVKEA